MPFLAVSAVVAGWCSHRYWMRLGNGDPDWARRFWPWLLQGLVFPILVFALFNIGWGSRLPPLVPQVLDAQRNGSPWFWPWLMWSLAGGLLVVFYWAAITYLWLIT